MSPIKAPKDIRQGLSESIDMDEAYTLKSKILGDCG